MISYDAKITAQAGARGHRPVHTLTVSGWGGSTVRWVDCGHNVTHGADVYTGRRFSFGTVAAQAGGASAQITVTVADHDRGVTQLALANDLRTAGVTVGVGRLYLDDLTAPLEALADALVVRSVRYMPDAVVWTVEASGAAATRWVPGRLVDPNCQWIFKDPATCRYTGAATSCDRTWATCVSYANTLHFGGYRMAARREV